VQTAVEQDLPGQAVRGYYNLADLLMTDARFAEAQDLLEQGLALARRRGDRQGERALLSQDVTALFARGRWNEAVARVEELRAHSEDIFSLYALALLAPLLAARGQVDELLALLEEFAAVADRPPAVKASLEAGHAIALREIGRAEEAAETAREALVPTLQLTSSEVPIFLGEAIEAAFAADRPEVAEEIIAAVDRLQPAQLIPMLDAEAARGRALLAARNGDEAAAERWFSRAIDLFREMEAPFALSRVELQYAEWYGATQRNAGVARQLADEAAERLEALEARPWLERARALREAVAA
jgi:tetratricopeptide (TPR) repeat protein